MVPRNDTVAMTMCKKLVNRLVADQDVEFKVFGVSLDPEKSTPHILPDSGLMTCMSDKRSTQAGYVIGLGQDRGNGQVLPFQVICWKSHKLRRKVRSTLAAEALAMCESIEHGELVRAMLKELREGVPLQLRDRDQCDQAIAKIKMVAITDCKDLYDTVMAICKGPSEQRLLLDIEGLNEYLNVELRWIQTSQQLADCLTKDGVDLYFRWCFEHGEFFYKKDERCEEKCLAIKRKLKLRLEKLYKNKTVKAEDAAETMYIESLEPWFEPKKMHIKTNVANQRQRTVLLTTMSTAAAALLGRCQTEDEEDPVPETAVETWHPRFQLRLERAHLLQRLMSVICEEQQVQMPIEEGVASPTLDAQTLWMKNVEDALTQIQGRIVRGEQATMQASNHVASSATSAAVTT